MQAERPSQKQYAAHAGIFKAVHGHPLDAGLATEEGELAPEMCLAAHAPWVVGSSYFEQDLIVTEVGCEVLGRAVERRR